jgi:outer membrane lipase/esterase
MRASEAFIMGAAYGQDRTKGSFGGGAGGFKTRENVFSLFGGVRWGGFYGSGVFSIANIDFKDVNRNIVLGPVTRTAQARTDGSNGSVFLSAGYDFQLGRLAIGPTVSVTSQNVTVNAFDESGAGSADLHIAEQTRRSEVWSAGVRASYALERWTPWLRVTADHERRDDVRMVTASPLSLATNNSYDIPAYTPDNSFVTGAIGVNGAVGEHIGVSVSYYYVSGRSGIKDNGLAGIISYRF